MVEKQRTAKSRGERALRSRPSSPNTGREDKRPEKLGDERKPPCPQSGLLSEAGAPDSAHPHYSRKTGFPARELPSFFLT